MHHQKKRGASPGRTVPSHSTLHRVWLAMVCLIITFNAGAALPAPLGTNVWFDYHQLPEARADALIQAMTMPEKISQLMDHNVAIPRLGLPEYNWWNEALHGVARNGRATVFPQAIALGATFDTNLAWQVGTAISDEARAKYVIAQQLGNNGRYAGLTFWTPNINIFRDPRWGTRPGDLRRRSVSHLAHRRVVYSGNAGRRPALRP